jgi:hypothetical protein
VQGGQWAALAVATHQRRHAGHGSPGGGAFNPAVAIQFDIDRLTPETVTSIPYRAFCRAIHGEPGVLYYFGGLHSNYAGNETDRIDLRDLASPTVGVSINHQPRVPPQGPESGYGSGSSGYVYKQYDTPLTDGAGWMPYSHHTWCQSTWHPDHGHLLNCRYAQGNGLTVGANPAGVGTQYQQASSVFGLVSYNYQTGKYGIAKTRNDGFHYSDFDPFRKTILSLTNTNQTGQFYEWDGVSASATARAAVDFQATLAPPLGVYSNSSGNGHLIRYIEPGRYLWYFPADNTPGKTIDEYHRIFIYDVVLGTTTRIPIPSNVQAVLAPYYPNGDMLLSFCVDRAGRRVFWCAVDGPVSGGASQGPLRVWVSNIDKLTVWAELSMTNVPTVISNMAYDREPLKFFNGHLFYLSQSNPSGNGDLVIHRMPVDPGTEIPPAFNFNRHKEGSWAFSTGAKAKFSMAKHVNWAYNSDDGQYYEIGGDVGASFTQSMASVSVNATTHSFREELDELTPAPMGYVRPGCPDDGAWAYSPAGNANTAIAGRFIFFRGGDGIGVNDSLYMRARYPNSADAIADRWSIAKCLVYDPINKRFNDPNVATWTLVQGSRLTGGDLLAHPATWAAAASRNGAWDASTNTMFRFAKAPTGSVVLQAWRFDTQQVRIYMANFSVIDGVTVDLRGGSEFTVGSTIHPSKKWWYLDGTGTAKSTLGPEWEHQNVWVNPADGKLYIVSPVTGLLWCFETRGAETDTADGLQIPFYAVGERIPFQDRQFLTPGGNSAPGGGDVRMQSCLVPFKGGLFYWCNQPGGSNGVAQYAFWRRLGHTGAWTPITLPQEWACNGVAPKFNLIDNNEFFAIGSGGGAGVDSPWFFLVN